MEVDDHMGMHDGVGGDGVGSWESWEWELVASGELVVGGKGVNRRVMNTKCCYLLIIKARYAAPYFLF